MLVADDERFIANNLAKNISDLHPGFTVDYIARDGEEALQFLKTHEVDLVFTDIKMPVIDGLTLTKKLYDTRPHTKVVIISGYNDFDLVKSALQYNAFDYLLKPVNKQELQNLLQKLYDSYQMESEHLTTKHELSKENIVENIKLYIKHHFEQPLFFGDIAKEYGFSQSYLSKIFKLVNGNTPLQYLTDYRIHQAKRLLRETIHTVGQVGEMVGIADPFHFSKLFKENVGESPKSYRNRYHAK